MADEQPPLPANAEDRKAASALANLDDDAAHDDASTASSAPVDLAAINKATKGSSSSAAAAAASATRDAAYKNVKVDAADVALLVEELELPRARATELLKRHEGDAVRAMRAYVTAA